MHRATQSSGEGGGKATRGKTREIFCAVCKGRNTLVCAEVLLSFKLTRKCFRYRNIMTLSVFFVHETKVFRTFVFSRRVTQDTFFGSRLQPDLSSFVEDTCIRTGHSNYQKWLVVYFDGKISFAVSALKKKKSTCKIMKTILL